MENLGGRLHLLHRLHLFFSTFFLLSKVTMNNNNIIVINNDISIMYKNDSKVIKMCSGIFEV
jgi:hypothetical protein